MVTLPCRKKFVILQTEKRTKKTIEIWNTNTIITTTTMNTSMVTMSIITTMSTTTTMVFTITTTETTLRAALEQQGLIEGVEGDYGLYIYTVDGETIHESHHDWWRLTKNGELSELGVDHIQLADGDRYELSFVKGVY